MTDIDSLAALQSENARLVAPLNGHGIQLRLSFAPTQTSHAKPLLDLEVSRLSTPKKVTVFFKLFRGREHCNNTRADYTANTLPKLMCAFSIVWTPGNGLPDS
jgi:hypothetical protein